MRLASLVATTLVLTNSVLSAKEQSCDGDSAEALEHKCRKDSDSPICSGRGECKCGVCHCFPRPEPEYRVSGAFCECDNFNCPRHNRKICGGNGTCECGFCQCNPGRVGPACECPTSTDACLAENGKVCNGHGECICGRCKCESGDYGCKYSGPTCEETVSYGADVSEVHIYT